MEEITELQPVPDAHIPVMKFKFDGISIDLLYASISLLVVPNVSIHFVLSYMAIIYFDFIVVFSFVHIVWTSLSVSIKVQIAPR